MTLPREAQATPQASGPSLLDFFLSLDTPPGFRAELIDQEIIVTPPPDGPHGSIAGRIIRAIMRHAKAELIHNPDKGLITPNGRYIPDLIISPPELFDDGEPWEPCDGVELVGEVTSSKPEKDRRSKRLGYAQAGIPLYLLVDRERKAVTLFSDPDGEDYRATNVAPFGKELHLPDPFDLTVDTASWPQR